MKRMLISLGLAAALLGCVGPWASYYGDDTSALYRPREVFSAASQGPVPLIIRGAPFPGVDAMRLAGATIAGMSRSAALAPVRLTTGDPGPRSVDYRFIVAFGEPMLGANGLCAAPDAPFTPGDRLTATAAFCIGDRLLSTTRGRLFEPVKGPEDPAFGAFLQGLTDALLPPYNPRLPRCGIIGFC
jgi:hypothetical protein